MSLTLNIIELERDLDLEKTFTKRYISPEKLIEFLQNHYLDNLTKIGTSVLKKPILKVSIGTGKKNVIIWSQMHGNETTGTLSALDLLKFLKSDHNIVHAILSQFTLDIIFMLNPDGSEIWTRRNIVGIDINRDFLAEASVEMRILKEAIKQKEYHLAFNLHDQRTIFGVEGTKEPATLAFLSPSETVDRKVTETRKKSMGLIASLYNEMSQILPHRISRFTDEFYPRSAGDNIQKLGIPTLLFEGGHFPNDYYRQRTRKYFTIALITTLYFAATKNVWENNFLEYFKIPENEICFYDIVYRNVKLSNETTGLADIAIQYTERICSGEDEISFIAKIEEIGDLSFIHGHMEIDAKERTFFSKESKFPKIGLQADFQLDDWYIVNGKKLEQFA